MTKAYEQGNTKSLEDELHRCLGGVMYLHLPELEQVVRAFQTAVQADLQDQQQLNDTYLALQQAMQHYWTSWEQGLLPIQNI